MKRWLGLVLGVVFFAMLSIPPAFSAPTTYIRERSEAFYYTNGSPVNAPAGTGYIEVDSGSTQDVLLYVRAELSGTENTSLVSNVAYRNAAGSRTVGETTRLYVNTTDSASDLQYRINQSVLKIIRLKMDYRNLDGGRDLHANGSNIMEFNVTMSSNATLGPTRLVFQAARNTYGVNDAMNIFYSEPAADPFIDTDSDGFYDRLEWLVSISQDVNYTIRFLCNMTPDVNFGTNYMYIDPDSINGVNATFATSQLMSGLTAPNMFSRGPVRQGMEMVNRSGRWFVRGFIMNTANDLSYALINWSLYDITTPGGKDRSDSVLANTESISMPPGDVQYTGFWNTSGSKQEVYYSAAFEWHVQWGDVGFFQESRSSMDLPYIYAIDVWPDKAAAINSSSGGLVSVRITDRATHMGHSSMGAERAEIRSFIPYQDVNGSFTNSWFPSNITVYYTNNSGEYNITQGAQITAMGSGPGNGYVLVEFSNLSSVLGRPMGQNEEIKVSYSLTGSMDAYARTYRFSVDTTLYTESGTPVTRTAEYNLTVPGTGLPPVIPPGVIPPGGAGMPVIVAEEYYASIVKEESDIFFVSDDFVAINVTYGIFDSGTRGVKDVKIAVYIPAGGEMDEADLVLSIYHKESGTWENMKNKADFTVKRRMAVKIGNKEYVEYIIEKKVDESGIYGKTLDLKNGDKIKVGYKTKIPPGSNYILTRAFGYNYYRNMIMFEDLYTPVRRDILIENFRTTEDEWRMKEAVVGYPVTWVKRFHIYNPNNMTVSQMTTTRVFPDTMSANIQEYRDSGVARKPLELKSGNFTYVNWVAEVCGLCDVEYDIEASTPPVAKTEENMDVLETNETTVIFGMNITIRNMAVESYANVTLNIPINKSKIIYVGDGLKLTENGNGVSMTIPGMTRGETRQIFLKYREIPPIMVTSLNALEYSCADQANITVFVIPAETHYNSYLEFEMIGPYPSLKTSYADIIGIGETKKFSEVRIPITVKIFDMPTGKYMTYTKFRDGFTTILRDQREFTVECEKPASWALSWVIIAIGCSGIISFLLVRVYRKRNYSREMDDIKRKLKDLE
jgi:hypothetical protein